MLFSYFFIQGDSGGPLQALTEKDGHYRIIGEILLFLIFIYSVTLRATLQQKDKILDASESLVELELKGTSR